MDSIEDFSCLESTFDSIKKEISKEPSLLTLIIEIKYIQQFVDNLGFLVFGRDILFLKQRRIITLTPILNSIVQTLQSILVCCEYGNLADASTLLRKYRDDLFFSLYLIVVCDDSNFFNQSELNKDEKLINNWLKNELRGLNIGYVFSQISKSTKLIEAVKKYNLEDSFNIIGKNLNNFVHSNGIDYYNKKYHQYSEKELKSISELFVYNLKYITMAFLFLLSLVRNIFIMSYDYTDAIDCGSNPTEGSQYWVAPFVSDFINKNGKLLDDGCKEYLREITSMEI